MRCFVGVLLLFLCGTVSNIVVRVPQYMVGVDFGRLESWTGTQALDTHFPMMPSEDIQDDFTKLVIPASFSIVVRETCSVLTLKIHGFESRTDLQ